VILPSDLLLPRIGQQIHRRNNAINPGTAQLLISLEEVYSCNDIGGMRIEGCNTEGDRGFS